MKLFSFLLGISTIFSVFTVASEAIMVKNLNNDEIVYQKGDVYQRKSPCSTFKIALSLMGFDLGILQDEFTPTWAYNEEKYNISNDLWKSIHYPQNWIQHSCIWYSKELVSRLGLENFKNYISLLHYGNEDISGDLGLSDGHLNCWLSSSLKISPLEQVAFLQKLLKQDFPISSYAQEITKKLLFVEELSNGYKLFGKRGAGFQNNGFQMGWFIGWITKLDKTFIFVIFIQDEKSESFPAGLRAQEKIKELFAALPFLRFLLRDAVP